MCASSRSSVGSRYFAWLSAVVRFAPDEAAQADREDDRDGAEVRGRIQIRQLSPHY